MQTQLSSGRLGTKRWQKLENQLLSCLALSSRHQQCENLTVCFAVLHTLQECKTGDEKKVISMKKIIAVKNVRKSQLLSTPHINNFQSLLNQLAATQYTMLRLLLEVFHVHTTTCLFSWHLSWRHSPNSSQRSTV